MRSAWPGSRMPRIRRHLSIAASRSRTRKEMWSSRISGMCSPFGRCGTEVLELELAEPERIDGLEGGALLAARRRRLRRVVGGEREAGVGDDVIDGHARMDALEQRPLRPEADDAAVGH